MQQDNDEESIRLKELQLDCQKITRRYREAALQVLADGDGDEPTTEIAEYFLDKLWKEGDFEGDDSNGQVIYCCQACGNVLHPGFEGTTLRLKRMDVHGSIRTLRRRKQRKERKLRMNRQREAKDINNSNRNRKSKARKESDPPVRMVLLGDDSHLVLERHHIEITCGKCRTKTLLKGMKRKSAITKQEVYSEQAALKVNQKIKRRSEVPRSGDQESSADFLQLPPAAKKPKTTRPQSIPTFGKKKKKNAPTGNKSKLMNFLSSLND